MSNKLKHGYIDSGLDNYALNVIAEDNILDGIKDEKQIQRVALNYECETLRELKELDKALTMMDYIFSICSKEKMVQMFTKIDENLEKETKKAQKSEKSVTKSK